MKWNVSDLSSLYYRSSWALKWLQIFCPAVKVPLSRWINCRCEAVQGNTVLYMIKAFLIKILGKLKNLETTDRCVHWYAAPEVIQLSLFVVPMWSHRSEHTSPLTHTYNCSGLLTRFFISGSCCFLVKLLLLLSNNCPKIIHYITKPEK